MTNHYFLQDYRIFTATGRAYSRFPRQLGRFTALISGGNLSISEQTGGPPQQAT